jgi:DNA (cytosine-5)-methyltransferase 3A
MSCGMIALDRLGIKVDNYYASEIDKYAIQVSQANYPDIIHVGDITKLDLSTLPKIDLVMGGSPCQGFSFAGKQLAFDDPRSALFFEFVKCVKELNPKYFLLENVKMKKEYLDIISEYMGVEPIFINSSLVSAQSRQRYYWTNIPNVEQPKERGIVLRDILEEQANTYLTDKAVAYMNRNSPKWSNGKSRKDIYIKHESQKGMCLTANMHKGVPYGVIAIDKPDKLDKMTTKDGKAYCVTASYTAAEPKNSIERKQRTMIPLEDGQELPENITLVYDNDGKSHKPQHIGTAVDVRAMTEVRTPEANQIRYEHKRRTGKDWSPRHMRHLVERPDEKMNTLTGALTKQHILQITKDPNQEVYWRKLTPLECERLQTVPDNYTNHVSNTQRYKMLGNGWTIEVIAHILKNMEV